MFEVTHGEYGQVERGIRGKQIVFTTYSPRRWYIVDYVIENMQDPLGTLEVTGIHRVKDEFGMGTASLHPVTGEEYDDAEKKMRGTVLGMVTEI